MNFDELMMHRCLALAACGAGKVGSNPMVGALLTVNGAVIGEGFHEFFGGKHAEINALESVAGDQKNLINQSTLYVNLEPCNHFGKTPPCTDAIINAQIKRVVIGTADPNTKVSGGGCTKLMANGVEVLTGISEVECRELNKFYFTFAEKGRPYITLKWAQSADGLIAHKDQTPIHFTNEAADKLVHKWRTSYASIFVGGGTVVADDPLLTARKWPGNNPLRVVLNSREEFDQSKRILNEDAPTIIFNYDKDEIKNNVKFIRLQKEKQIVQQMLDHLYRENINSILVEGGPKTIALFVDGNYWDEARIFISPEAIGSGMSAPQIPGSIAQTETIDGQLLITTYPA